MSVSGMAPETSKKAMYPLAFPKGTCVLRFSDLTTEYRTETLWVVENHILIKKLVLDGPFTLGRPTRFQVTNRYQGWFYDEPWDFVPLSASPDPVTEGGMIVTMPTMAELDMAFEKAQIERSQAILGEERARVQLERKVKQLRAIKSRRKRKKEPEDDEEHE